MAIYTITYLINSIGFFANKRSKKIINCIVLMLLIFISGTRYYLGGTDVLFYEYLYNSTPTINTVLKYIFTGINNGVDTGHEIGFLLICSIIKQLGFSYFGFTLLYATLFYILLYNDIKEFVVNWAPFWAVFMYKIMFYNTFVSLRQGMTIAIFCYMMKYIRDGKIFKYFAWCIMAFFVHRGALILFPLYFIRYIPVTRDLIKFTALVFAPTWFFKKYINLGAIINIVISVIGFSDKSSGWGTASESIGVIHTLECYAVVVMVLIFYNKIISQQNEQDVKLILRLFLVTIPIFTLFSNWIVMTREKDYFVLMYGLLFGYILKGGTTSQLEETREKISGACRSITGSINAKIIALVILLICYIGIVKYITGFDGGSLTHFVSFTTKGVSIFAN